MGINGNSFSWARYPFFHRIKDVKALKGKKALTLPVAWPYPVFIHRHSPFDARDVAFFASALQREYHDVLRQCILC